MGEAAREVRLVSLRQVTFKSIDDIMLRKQDSLQCKWLRREKRGIQRERNNAQAPSTADPYARSSIAKPPAYFSRGPTAYESTSVAVDSLSSG